MENESYLGHRKRCKERFLQTNGDGLFDYEILEILLFFVNKRSDTKQLSKRLLFVCKNLENIFCMKYEDWLHIEGVGEQTAILFAIINTIYKRIALNNAKNLGLNAIDKCYEDVGSSKIEDEECTDCDCIERGVDGIVAGEKGVGVLCDEDSVKGCKERRGDEDGNNHSKRNKADNVSVKIAKTVQITNNNYLEEICANQENLTLDVIESLVKINKKIDKISSKKKISNKKNEQNQNCDVINKNCNALNASCDVNCKCNNNSVGKNKNYCNSMMNSVLKVVTYYKFKIGYTNREHFCVMFLNNKNMLITEKILQVGTVDSAAIYPREILKMALNVGAVAIIIVHNHPSGDPTPSIQDIEITDVIGKILKNLNIKLHDHIIVAQNNYVSLKELGLM